MKMEQRLVHRTDLRQVQRQILSPRIIQSIEILQLPTQDLEKLVQNELSENPTLELAQPEVEERLDGMDNESHPENKEEADRLERDLEFLERYTDDFNDRAPRRSASRLDGEVDAKQEALSNTPARNTTLQEYLFRQLAMLELDDCIRDAVEIIIEALDENGHLAVPLESVAGACPSEGAMDVAREALEVVQSLEPLGVGARNTPEALLLQISRKDQDYGLYATLLTDHWDDLSRNKLPKVAKDTNYSIEDIKFAIEQIATLDPYPGRNFSQITSQRVIPDIIIEEPPDDPGNYQVQMVDEYLPRLHISDKYRRMLETAADDETRDFIKTKIEAARNLIEAVHQRQSTLERVATSILSRQREFMEVGVSGLRPLRMQEVADELGVHVSTICRAVADKYIDTPQGICALKFFFVGGTESAEGEDTSRHAVKQQLQHIVDTEDSTKPLSDIAIANMLSETCGISIARRTVAKYRDQLNIPDSRQRKTY